MLSIIDFATISYLFILDAGEILTEICQNVHYVHKMTLEMNIIIFFNAHF